MPKEDYFVAYEINIRAENPEEAALLAFKECMSQLYQPWLVTDEQGNQREILIDSDRGDLAE